MSNKSSAENVKDGKRGCLRCGNKVKSRGLCANHHQQFTRALDAAEEKGLDRQKADDEMVEQGLALPAYGDKNPFMAVIEEMAKKTPPAPITTDPALDKQLIAASEKDLAKRKPADKKEVIPEKKPVSTKKGSQK